MGIFYTAFSTTTVFLLLHLPIQIPKVSAEVIPLIIMFMTKLEVLLVYMTQATEPIVMWTYSHPVQNSSMTYNLVPQLLVLTAVVELHSSQCMTKMKSITVEKGSKEPDSCPDDSAARRASKSNLVYCHSVQICPSHTKSWVSGLAFVPSMLRCHDRQASGAHKS
jgi:hypothetical protein